MLNWIQLLYLCWVLNMSIFRSVLEYIYLSKNLLSAQSVIPFTLLLSTQYLYFCIGAWVLNKSKFCMEIEWISYNHFVTQLQTIFVYIECSMWYAFYLSIEHSILVFLHRWLSTQYIKVLYEDWVNQLQTSCLKYSIFEFDFGLQTLVFESI